MKLFMCYVYEMFKLTYQVIIIVWHFVGLIVNVTNSVHFELILSSYASVIVNNAWDMPFSFLIIFCDVSQFFSFM